MITVKELCERYLADAENGLVLGKKRLPKKASTLATDRGRIDRHIIPLLGSRLANDITTADVNRFMRDVSTGTTRTSVKTRPRGRAIVRGGRGTASRTTGLLGGIFTYAVGLGIVANNPVRGVRRPADLVRDRRLSDEEYRVLGRILEAAVQTDEHHTAIAMIRLLALTGCRRGEIINLRWDEVDEARGCFKLRDSKEGRSIRPIGHVVFEILASIRPETAEGYVFPSAVEGKPFIGLPKIWRAVVGRSALADVTPHVLRHSFASAANDLGFTEATIASMLGHSRGTMTSRYVHHIDAVLVNAADVVSSHIWSMLSPSISLDAFRTFLPLQMRSLLALPPVCDGIVGS